MSARYRVLSRFYCRETGGYVDVGAPCPAEVGPESAERLIRAGCLARDEAGSSRGTAGASQSAPSGVSPAAPQGSPAAPRAPAGPTTRPPGPRGAAGA